VTNDNTIPFLAVDPADPRELAEALKESHELLALAEQSAGIGIWDTDLATDRVRGTPTFFRLMGLPVATVAIPNDVVRAVRHPDDAARVRAGFLEGLAKGHDTYEVEYRIIRPSDGELRWIFGRGRAVRDANGKRVRYSGVDLDITERKHAEAHVRLLMRELNHRANNLLTVIQALARLTANTPEARDFADRLGLRVMALASSSNLLVSGKWQGVEIAALVRSQLAHFATDLGERLALEGPALRLSAGGAQALGMALYELGTNAVKHGALANQSGRIAIRWQLDPAPEGDTFAIRWTECGGPPVKAAQHTGFGRTVVERMTSAALGGKAALAFDPDGIAWTLVCPAGRVLDAQP
jgi:PAS domain S-box-containing protein